MPTKESISANLTTLQEKLALYPHAKLIAVSKTHPIEKLMEAYEAGVRDFGENKVQELVQKAAVMPKDIRWHMIGHLQTNKVRMLLPYVHLIHSVDSAKLLKEINKEAVKLGKKIEVLLQVHIAQEETKYGFDVAELLLLIQDKILDSCTHIAVVGLMGMASLTDDKNKIRTEFQSLKALFDRLQSEYAACSAFEVLSMGMSSDFEIALETGSNRIRVGSTIFGTRQYLTE
jgi:hypothetical protein